MKEISKLLVKGLLAGYLGKEGDIKREVVIRGEVFPFKTSHLEKDGEVYHDEWTGSSSGGGQEVIQTKDGKRFTRVYGGGVANQEVLDELEITASDVLMQHKKFLREVGDKSRFDKDVESQEDGKWVYEYKVVDDLFEDTLDIALFGFRNLSEIHLTVGVEIVKYDEQAVFAHVFVLAPVTS